MIPGDYPWSFEEPFWTELRRHSALRLLGKFKGKDPQRLKELRHVEYLAVSRYPKFELGLIEDFDKLRTLELDFLQLKTLDGIEHLKLSMLGITELTQLDDIGALQNLPLIVLQLALCNRLRKYDPIGKLQRLVQCDIEANVVPSLAFLRRINTLRSVGLAVSKVESDAIAELSELTQLEWMGVRRRLLGQSGVAQVQTALPRCTIEVW